MPRNFLVKRTGETCEAELSECQEVVDGILNQVEADECVEKLAGCCNQCQREYTWFIKVVFNINILFTDTK